MTEVCGRNDDDDDDDDDDDAGKQNLTRTSFKIKQSST